MVQTCFWAGTIMFSLTPRETRVGARTRREGSEGGQKEVGGWAGGGGDMHRRAYVRGLRTHVRTY